ncbi:MAG: EAL domain-containing protein, partial [Spiribacter salinus]
WYTAHRRAHQGFTTELDRIASIDGPEQYRLQPLLEFLVRWLTLHILRSDKQMAGAIEAIEAGAGVADARERAVRHLREHSPSGLDSLLQMYMGVERQISEFAKYLASRGQEEAETRFHTLFDSFIHPLVVFDPTDGSIVDANPATSLLTGYSSSALKGKTIAALHPGREQHRFTSRMIDPSQDAPQGFEIPVYTRVLSAEGREVPVRITCAGEIRERNGPLRIAFYEDMTRELEHRRELAWRSFNDQLTGLPNRAGIMQTLNETSPSHEEDGDLAVITVDLNDFRALNQRLGIAAGDRVLVELSRRWREALPQNPDARIGRRGGDDFIIVLRDGETIARTESILQALVDAGHNLPAGPGETVDVSVGAGISIRPTGSSQALETIERQADHALYEVKLRGRHSWEYFDHAHYQGVIDHHRIIRAFREALQQGEIVLEYQPKVNMRTGAFLGVEALARWNHPERGRLQPAEFLPSIQTDPVSIELGEYVLDMALSRMESWQASGQRIPVSVNIGALQLEAESFPQRLETILDRHPSVPRSDLEIEVLETTAFDNAAGAERNMRAVRDLGLAMSIDDFGIGYSSLTYIKRVPANVLKMDRSYVMNMLHDSDDRAIAEAIIGLARSFDRLVIAEGVETMDHGRLLIATGCDYGQGYAIARPMPAEDLSAWLHSWRPPQEWTNIEPG